MQGSQRRGILNSLAQTSNTFYPCISLALTGNNRISIRKMFLRKTMPSGEKLVQNICLATRKYYYVRREDPHHMAGLTGINKMGKPNTKTVIGTISIPKNRVIKQLLWQPCRRPQTEQF